MTDRPSRRARIPGDSRTDSERMASMRARSGRALRGGVLAAAVLMLAACSKPAPEKKAEAPKKETPSARPMPSVYKVRFVTTKGPFVVEVNKQWAPYGAERFWRLVTPGFFYNSKNFPVKQ